MVRAVSFWDVKLVHDEVTAEKNSMMADDRCDSPPGRIRIFE
jgi:hypothetical protein